MKNIFVLMAHAETGPRTDTNGLTRGGQVPGQAPRGAMNARRLEAIARRTV